MRRIAITLMVAAVLAVLAVSPQAGAVKASSGADTTATESDSTKKAKEDPKAEEKKVIEGSDSKGKYYFKKSCKSCHGPKGDGGEITPVSKTIKQWQRYFDKGVHLRREGEDGEKVNEMLLKIKDIDEIKLIHIKTFLINHAADSDQPETCG